MARLACAGLLLFFSASVLAQDYAGTWTARHPDGGTVTLQLEQHGPGAVQGTLSGNGTSFDVDAEVRADGLQGMVSSEHAMVHLTGRISEAMLYILLMEPLPDGRPNPDTRRVIRFSRGTN